MNRLYRWLLGRIPTLRYTLDNDKQKHILREIEDMINDDGSVTVSIKLGDPIKVKVGDNLWEIDI